jgi:mRNA interferase MazF
MDLKRGDVVVCALSGDYGKPRPAVVVQSDLFNSTHASITICPITSHIVAAPLFRLEVASTQENGLKQESQIMVDKLTTLHKDKIQQKIGMISYDLQLELNKAIKLWMSVE